MTTPTTNRPQPGEWNYTHHTDTPIAKAAGPRTHRWFSRGDRVVVDAPRVARLSGATGTVVALQRSAVVVRLDDATVAGRYGDADGLVRFDDRAIAPVA
jgi:hypothetical protein